MADFVSKARGTKKTRAEPNTEVVEVMKRTTNMDSALRRLSELLLPFEEKVTDVVIEDEGAEAMMERERHVSQLHRRVTNLKESLDRTEEVAMNKVKKSLSENQVLVEEVNTLRHRLKAMTKDNQRQKASLDMMRLKLDAKSDNHRSDGRKNDHGVNLEDSLSEDYLRDNYNDHIPDGRSSSKPYNKGHHATQSTSIAVPAPKPSPFIPYTPQSRTNSEEELRYYASENSQSGKCTQQSSP